MLPARDRHKGSKITKNRDQLTTNEKTLYYTANDDTPVQLTILQRIVTIVNSNAFVLSLPPVSEARYLEFIITVTTSDATMTLTDFPNESYNDSSSWPGDFSLAAADDSITLRSDGQSWTVVSNDIA